MSKESRVRAIVGSNVGNGQIKAADYIVGPDIVSSNSNASRNSIGGALGVLFGGVVGSIISGIDVWKKSANVVLGVSDVRSSETIALSQGNAEKTNVSFGAGALLFPAAAGAGIGSYNNTEMGQIVALAYLDAYIKLFERVKAYKGNPKDDNVAQAVRVRVAGRMFEEPVPGAQIVRDLDPGMMLYPTGQKRGKWWEVEDELRNKGRAASDLFELAR